MKYHRTTNGVISYGYFTALEADGSSPHAISPASLFKDVTINKTKRLQWAA